MDLISRNELHELMEDRGKISLSLYMPTHRTGDIQQDPIRLKNLIREAEEKLKQQQLDEEQNKKFLQPVRDLLEHGTIWKYMSDGLAIFRTEDRFHLYRLPVSFTENVIVKDRFYIKPLLPIFTNNGHFYVLAVSQKEIRLLKGTRHTVNELDIHESIPESLSQILKEKQMPEGFQFHTGAGAGKAGQVRAAIFHGHGDEIDQKDQIRKYLREVDHGIVDIIKGGQLPMVLAGVEELRVLYKQVNSYPHILDEGINGNPDRIPNEELHSRAWEIVEPYFTTEMERDLERFNDLHGVGRTTVSIEEALPAAIQGRIESLFFNPNEHIWGRYDEQGNVTFDSSTDGADKKIVDLMDTLVVKSLSNGSTVYAVEPEAIPDGSQLAALYRF